MVAGSVFSPGCWASLLLLIGAAKAKNRLAFPLYPCCVLVNFQQGRKAGLQLTSRPFFICIDFSSSSHQILFIISAHGSFVVLTQVKGLGLWQQIRSGFGDSAIVCLKMPLMMEDEMDMDDLFGDGAGLSLPSRPPSKELYQRLDELRGSGCCQ